MALDLNNPEVLKERIADVLLSRMDELGLNKKEIADALDVCPATVTHLTQARSEYKYPLLRKVAHELGLDLVFLAFLVEEPLFKEDPIMKKVGTLLRKRDAQRRECRKSDL
jgi:transcriptional regulator with XRE-family HTH domain